MHRAAVEMAIKCRTFLLETVAKLFHAWRGKI